MPVSLYHQIALTLLDGVGSITARALLAHFQSPESIFDASVRELSQVPGIGLQLAHKIHAFDDFERVEEELHFIQKHHIKTLFITDQHYPKRLSQCYDAPVLLYYKGEADLNATKIVSIVGTRNATSYGKDLCEELIDALKVHEPVIVSGLAYGIDAHAHQVCVRSDLSTLGVLGHGLDRIYPSLHRNLAQKMTERGGLLSEFPSKTLPDRENFPKRNRIIAGLADATIVVEANVKGGALITADLANSYNRDVFAFPGRVDDVYSSGCNYLIKTNRAHLITNCADLEYLLGWKRKESSAVRQLQMPMDLTEDEKLIFELLIKHQSLAVDELLGLCKHSQTKLVSLTLALEMKGLIRCLPGNRYVLI